VKWLRAVLNLFTHHKLTMIFIVIIGVGLLLYARNWQRKSQGLLTAPLRRGHIVEAVYGIGTVVADRRVDVRAGQVDHLDQTFVKEGYVVKKGDRLVAIGGILQRAPFAGTITYISYKKGELVFPQTIVVSLVDMKDRYVTVSLEQQGALRVRPGQAVHISFDSMRDEIFQGTVRAAYSNNSEFLARIDVSSLPANVLPGMTADVAIIIQEKPDVLLVPVAAIEGTGVWKRSKVGPPQKIEIKTGLIDNDMAEVSAGAIEAGDQLVIHMKSGK
jgi:macrolide-specific efflux system membrane fusion protein